MMARRFLQVLAPVLLVLLFLDGLGLRPGTLLRLDVGLVVGRRERGEGVGELGEVLVEAAIERLKGKEDIRIADICTGSGAIALALAHYLPETSSAATDISADALEIAKQNAETLGLSERVQFFEGDLLAPLAGETFDAIVSNPPYIPGADIEGLPREVRAEPRLALDGGADGLDFYRRLVGDSAALLNDGGFLAVECGDTQAGAIAEMAATGGFGKTEIIRDLADKERVVVLWKA